MTTPEHTIQALCQRSRDISLEKGWLSPDGTDPRPFHTVVSLFHTELSEAFEDIRSNYALRDIFYEQKGGHTVSAEQLAQVNAERHRQDLSPVACGELKPCGFPVELADFVIRVCQYYGSALQGKKLADTMDAMAGTVVLAQQAPDDAELLITHLHASCSAAFVDRDKATTPLHHLAMALLLTFAFCKKKDIDLWAAIDEKEAYNRTRPIRHGGKAC